MWRTHWAALAILWTGDLHAAVIDQRAMDDGGRVFRQAMRWPVEMATEYWYYIVGAVVLILVVRSYLRK